jgi:hypothetical protein
MKRNRLAYGSAVIVVVAFGLASRRYAAVLPWWVGAYVGDALWASMLYLVLGVIARGLKPGRLAVLTLALSYGVEISQLFHSPWIDAVRHTRLGGYALGHGFLWSDLVCYTLGVASAYGAERAALRRVACR